MKPKIDDGERKAGVFAGDSEEEVNKWIDLLAKVSQGVNIAQPLGKSWTLTIKCHSFLQ